MIDESAFEWLFRNVRYVFDGGFGSRVRYLDTVASEISIPSFRGIVKLTDCRLFWAFLHEAKPLNLHRAAIDNLPKFRSNFG